MLRYRKTSIQHKKDKERNEEFHYHDTSGSTIIGWVGPITLRKRAKPELENERYTDISLRLSVQEVKNVSPKNRYFCEVCLDRTLYARTTSKMSDGSVFWGETFELHNLSEIAIITINLYKQGNYTNKERKQKTKPQNQFISFVTIPVTEVSQSTEYQNWLSMQPTQQIIPPPTRTDSQSNIQIAENKQETRFRKKSMPVMRSQTSDLIDPTEPVVVQGRNKKKKRSWTAGFISSSNEVRSERASSTIVAGSSISQIFQDALSSSEAENKRFNTPQIRLNVQYECVQVLPLGYYTSFRQFLGKHSIEVLRSIEPKLTAKQKAVFASSCVNIYEKSAELSVSDLLCSLLEEDLQQNTHKSMLLRYNSLASKAVECYIKLIGHYYLQKLMKPVIDQMLKSADDFELDPARINTTDTNSSGQDNNCLVEINYHALLKQVNFVWKKIYESAEDLPWKLHRVFCVIRLLLERVYDSHTASQVVSSCLFLRFICPAILGPVLFNLTSSVPESNRICRNLTLVAKVLQNLANLTVFGDKEPHMKLMNSFVENEIPAMEEFLVKISSSNETMGNSNTDVTDVHMYIDLGYEFAKLASLLADILQDVELPHELIGLADILTFLHEHTTNSLLAAWSTNSSNQQHHHHRSVSMKNNLGNIGQNNQVFLTTMDNSVQSSRPRFVEACTNSTSSSIVSINQLQLKDNSTTDSVSCQAQGLNKHDQQNNHDQYSPTSIQDSQESSTADFSIMERLLMHYDEQLRQLNECIDQVSEVCSGDSKSGLEWDSSGCRSISSNVVNGGYDNQLYTSHYDFGDNFQPSDAENGECKSEPLEVSCRSPARDGTLRPQTNPSESPSLEQLTDKLDELKRALNIKRQQLTEVVETKTKVINVHEKSIEQLAMELERLRHCPRRSKPPYSAPSTSGLCSPSHHFHQNDHLVQYESDCNGSDVGPITTHTPQSNIPTTSSKVLVNNRQPHNWNEKNNYSSPDAQVHKRRLPLVYNSRSSSFRSRNTHFSELSTQNHNNNNNNNNNGGSNLYNLTRVSEGTGIPLTELILTSQQQQHRRNSTTKLGRN